MTRVLVPLANLSSPHTIPALLMTIALPSSTEHNSVGCNKSGSERSIHTSLGTAIFLTLHDNASLLSARGDEEMVDKRVLLDKRDTDLVRPLFVPLVATAGIHWVDHVGDDRAVHIGNIF